MFRALEFMIETIEEIIYPRNQIDLDKSRD